MQKSFSFVLISILVIVLCCCLISFLGTISYLINFYRITPSLLEPVRSPQNTSTAFDFSLVTPDPDIFENLYSLEHTLIPIRDLPVLACRYKHICEVPDTLDSPESPYEIGSQREFWITDSDTGVHNRISATLKYLTDHAYLWIEEGIEFNHIDAQNLINTFEKEIYPVNREFFGSEWTPGIDNDPHIYIIYTRNLGEYVAGYYISLDEYHPLVEEYSNAIEGFYVDASQDLGDDYTMGTLAHEFQHMIHWYQDTNESSFLDEGFSVLATFLNGYNPGGFDWVYTGNPDIILTDWQETEENSAHYGANFLFVNYFLDRFGSVATQALIHDQYNELESVDNTLSRLGIIDPLTREVITADDFFLDWVLTNYIHDKSVSDGRYFYYNYPSSPQTTDTERISICPTTPISRTVNQYGVDYIRITCPGNHLLSFYGSTAVPLLPTDFHSGKYAFWSNKSNESNTYIQKQFDFSEVAGPITLSFWIWFDIEPTYDFVYLEISTDGENWEILKTPSGTGDNPTGSSYGWGYTGESGEWTNQTIDISRYAGQNVTLRFDYITDAAVVHNGFLLDDISIPEIGYKEDFELSEGNWTTGGFVRVQNNLPQNYRLALIHHIGRKTNVEIISPSFNSPLDIPINIESGDDIVFVITATTRFTISPAGYQLTIR